MTRSAFVLIVIVLSVASNAHADPQTTRYVQDYVSSLRRERIPVFYTGCKRKNEGRVLLIMGLGRKTGLMAEGDSRDFYDTAEVGFLRDEWVAGETEGGLWSLKRVQLLADELSTYEFRLVMPNDLSSVLVEVPARTCKDIQPP
jgi:hypothetical protein